MSKKSQTLRHRHASKHADHKSAKAIQLLLVDDDSLLLESTQLWLEDLGLIVQAANGSKQATEFLVRDHFDAVLCDLRMDQGCGLEVLRAAKTLQPNCCCIAMSGFATPQEEIQAFDAGAQGFLRKPWKDAQLLEVLERTLREHRVSLRESTLNAKLNTVSAVTDNHASIQRNADSDHSSTQDWLESLGWLGSSPQMHELFETLEAVTEANVSVLILGENGTGKSKLAKCIHSRSRRQHGPFVELACGAIQEHLLESELFGHVAGAFTGAHWDRPGKIRAAQGGSLFLDEIGTASMAMQVKLLRVLQDRTLEPVGSNETFYVDTRFLFATNERLDLAVAQGRFREDLYYRIHVVPIELPPLRNRIGDLPNLANHFLHQANKMFEKDIQGICTQAMRVLMEHPWPGNIRELENTLYRAVAITRSNFLDARTLHRILQNTRTTTATTSPRPLADATEYLEFHPHHTAPPARVDSPATTQRWSESFRDLDDALAIPERQILIDALTQYDWNRNTTADRLGINRTTLYKKMKRLGISQTDVQRKKAPCNA